MGVYIKGMEMSTIEMEWTIRHGADGKWYAIDTNVETSDGEWHEIIPVPPHGDLIDQDEYREEFMNGVYALCSDDQDNYRANAIIDLFDSAPTIIPAEEGET